VPGAAGSQHELLLADGRAAPRPRAAHGHARFHQPEDQGDAAGHRPLIDELLDAVATGPCPADLFADFCLALPTMVIARMLGVPAEDYRWFSEQSRLCLALDSPERSVTAYAEINAYLHRLAQAKESEPADDLISRVINDYVAIGLLDRDDLVPLVRLVLIVGFETTSNQSR
jgi:cytochrome P450